MSENIVVKKERKKRSGCRNAFKNIFVLVVGMLLGIILFIGAIVGTVYVVLTSISVGNLQDTLGVSLIAEDNKEMLDKSVLEVATDIISLVGNINTVSINDILDKFNLPIPKSISGIDITPLFKYPINDISNHVNEVTEKITLESLSNLAGINFDEYSIPLLKELKTETINVAIDTLLSKISGEISLRMLEKDFGLSVANDNVLLNNLKDVSIGELGNVIDYLTLNDIIDIDNDVFIKASDMSAFTPIDNYQAITNLSTQGLTGSIVETAIFGVNEFGLDKKELRYVKSSDSEGNAIYVVDNSSYSIAKDATEFEGYKKNADGDFVLDLTLTGKTFYRHITHTAYSALNSIAFVNGYSNSFALDGENYVPINSGIIEILNPNSISIGTSTTSTIPTSISEFTPSLIINPTTTYYVMTVSEGVPTFSELVQYAVPTGATKDSTLTEYVAGDSYQETGYYLLKCGTSDTALKTIAFTTIKNLASVTDKIKNLKLNDIMEITADSPKVLQSLQDTTINNFSNTINTLSLCDIIDIYPETIYEEDGITIKNEKSSKILISLQNSTLNSLSTDIGKMTLSDVIEINNDATSLLKKLAYTNINSLATAISDIVQNMFLSEFVNVNLFNQLSVNTDSTTYLNECNEPFIEDENGAYVLINGIYTAYNDTLHLHEKRYSKKVQYIKSTDGAYIFIPQDNSAYSYVSFTAASIKYDIYGFIPYDKTNENMPSFTEEYVADALGTNTIDFYALDVNAFNISDPNSVFVKIDATNYNTYKSITYGKYLNTYSTDTAEGYYGFAKIPKNFTPTETYKKVYAKPQLLEETNSADFAGKYILLENELTIFDSNNAEHLSHTLYIPMQYNSNNSGFVYYSTTGTDFVLYDETIHGKISLIIEENPTYLYSMVKYDATNNTHLAYTGNKYIYYSGLAVDTAGSNLNHKHFNLIYGYIAGSDEIGSAMSDGTNVLNTTITNTKNITPICYLLDDDNNEIKQSENALIAINNSSIYNLNDVFVSLTLGDLIQEEPDSFFEGSIMTSSIKNMSSAITTKLSNANMGQILTWAKISVIPEISSALADVTLNDFFEGLSITVIDGTPYIVFEITG